MLAGLVTRQMHSTVGVSQIAQIEETLGRQPSPHLSFNRETLEADMNTLHMYAFQWQGDEMIRMRTFHIETAKLPTVEHMTQALMSYGPDDKELQWWTADGKIPEDSIRVKIVDLAIISSGAYITIVGELLLTIKPFSLFIC